MKLPKLRFPKFIPKEIILMALDSVRAHKLRSFLTVLGIIIGVMTAITIASILTGLRQNIVQMIEEYGTNNIYAFHLSTGILCSLNSQASDPIASEPIELSIASTTMSLASILSLSVHAAMSMKN